MPEALLQISGLYKRYGGVVATDSLDLTIEAGEVHAVIGPNGAGKTTLVSQISGEQPPDAGTILFAGRDVTRLPAHRRARMGLRRSFQVTSVFPQLSVRDNVGLALQAQAGHSFRFWRDAGRDPALRRPAEVILRDVGLDAVADRAAATISYGEKRALEIGMVLAGEPLLLLLDEPMAGMGPADAAEIAKLLRRLKQRVAVLLVDHDMDMVFSLADRVTVLVYGRAIATGTPDEIRRNDEVQRAYLGEDALA
jgi:branched-chain amino acid transport system ATP-binding protein